MYDYLLANSRKQWFQLAVILVTVAVSVIFLASSPDWHSLRASASTALQSVTLLFAVISALSISLYSNSIKGRQEKYSKQISIIRDLLEEFHDKNSNSEDPDIVKINEIQIHRLLRLSSIDWLDFDTVSSLRYEIDDEIKETIDRLNDQQHWIYSRYRRIEDEINELAVQHIGRHLAGIYYDVIRYAFLIIIFAMVTIVFSGLLLDNPFSNALIVVLNSALMALSVIQTFQLLFCISRETNEEIFRIK